MSEPWPRLSNFSAGCIPRALRESGRKSSPSSALSWPGRSRNYADDAPVQDFFVAFAGQTVQIRFDSRRVGSFLTLLFGDMQSFDPACSPASVLDVTVGKDDIGRLMLVENGEFCAAGALGVSFAAVVFDRVMFHLLRDTGGGVALHTGAVARDRRVLLIPGCSHAFAEVYVGDRSDAKAAANWIAGEVLRRLKEQGGQKYADRLACLPWLYLPYRRTRFPARSRASHPLLHPSVAYKARGQGGG